MCGIFAAVGPKAGSVGARHGEQILSHMKHRGPDDANCHMRSGVSLLHTRLAIVAPLSAQQPMFSSDGRYGLVFNGELFNSAALRRMPTLRDFDFRTDSDTETLLALLTSNGIIDSCREIRGFYAFVLVDFARNSVVALRDPLGIKPLHYAIVDETLLIASEVGALRLVRGVGDRPRDSCFSEFLVFGSNSGNETLFSDISRLRPGEVLRWEQGAIAFQDAREALLPSRPSLESGSAQELAKGLREVLAEATSLWTGGDVAVDALVSGGIDSVSIATLAGDRVSKNHTLRFEDAPEFDEGKQLGVRLRQPLGLVSVNSEVYARLFNDAVRVLDEPMSDPNYLSFWALSRAVSQGGTKAALIGDGADELFGGYERHNDIACQYEAFGNSDTIVWARNKVALNRLKILGVRLPANISPRRDFVASLLLSQTPHDVINTVLEYDQRFFLEMYLQQKDRVGMRNGVEFRPVFLDQKVVSYARAIPGSLKVHPRGRKYILRLAVSDLLGEANAFEPKKLPFSAPIDTMWRRGSYFDTCTRSLFDKDTRLDEYLSPRGVVNLLEQHQAGRENHLNTLWRVVALEAWMRASFA